MVNLNERKATAGNIKPHLIRLGGRWIHEIIYNIIREIWNEKQIESVNLLNESKVVLLLKNPRERWRYVRKVVTTEMRYCKNREKFKDQIKKDYYKNLEKNQKKLAKWLWKKYEDSTITTSRGSSNRIYPLKTKNKSRVFYTIEKIYTEMNMDNRNYNL